MRHLIVTTVCGLLVAAACYPTGFDNVEETDVVLTVRDPGRDYTVNRTYVLTSTVFDLTPILDPDNPIDVSDEFDELILDTIREEMAALGYVEETDPETNRPDVGVAAGKVVQEGWVLYGYPGWNPWYPPYPPIVYPPFPVARRWRIGTLLIPIIEIGDREPDDPVVVAWFGIIDGLISSSSATNAARIEDNIRQAFEQSPYLETGAQP
jgi:hypothetical protein